ncbi:MAG: DUF1513 domain-containing protein, partial [Pseudomonadota bacterium]
SIRHLAWRRGSIPKMAIDRRQFLIGSGAVIAASVPGTASTLQPAVYLSSARTAAGRHSAILFDEDGQVQWQVELPDRGHGGAFRRGTTETVIFARRPGTFAFVMDRSSGALRHVMTTPEDRHFYGHGTFSADARLLFTTENDFVAGRGVVGVWDAADGYRRVAEFDAGGIGPHDIALMPGGTVLAVANGGILTLPDSGRHKLNIADMKPSLVFIDVGDGKRVSSHALPAELHKLSIRHMAVTASGAIVIAMQYEGPGEDRVPLVCRYQAGRLHLMTAPDRITAQMKNYCGSVAVDRSGQTACVTAPRGNLSTFWSVADGTYLASTGIEDGCGVSAAIADGNFLISSGTGRLLTANPGSMGRMSKSGGVNLAWDNHIAGQPVPDVPGHRDD